MGGFGRAVLGGGRAVPPCAIADMSMLMSIDMFMDIEEAR